MVQEVQTKGNGRPGAAESVRCMKAMGKILKVGTVGGFHTLSERNVIQQPNTCITGPLQLYYELLNPAQNSHWQELQCLIDQIK